jgi:protease I
MTRIAGQRIAFLVSNQGVEEAELSKPWEAVLRAGALPTLIAPRRGLVHTVRAREKSAQWKVDESVRKAEAVQFDALVLPGGFVNCDLLRSDRFALQFVASIFRFGRPCAVISHSALVLVAADLIRDRKLTCWPNIKSDVQNAGGEWVDAESVVCRNGSNVLLSSRAPGDLAAFCSALRTLLEEQANNQQPELELTGISTRSGLLTASVW